MPNKKISQLDDGGAIQGNDIFPIVRGGNNFKVNLPDAAPGVRGVLSTGYQNIDGAKTFRNDSADGVKGAGLYNADPTDNNGISINFETDTTGAGAQIQFATGFFGSQVTDHNNASVTATVYWTTYINGASKSVWSMNDNLDLYTDGKITTGNDININSGGNLQVNNGFVRGGTNLDVLTGQGFNQNMNSLGGGIHVPLGTPIVGTNIFGTNLAVGFIWEDDMDGGIIPFLGASAVGYVGYMAGLTSGKTMETINMAIAGLSDQGSVAGAILNNLNMFTAGGLLGGSAATINNIRGFYVAPSFGGGVAANEWGVLVESLVDNGFAKSITIGGDLKTTNADIAFEIKGLKALKLANLTTAQKDAIASPELGMEVFDTDLDQVSIYTSGGWIGPGGFPYTPEDVANKSNDPTMSTDSDVLYPTQQAAKIYTDTTSIINSIIFG